MKKIICILLIVLFLSGCNNENKSLKQKKVLSIDTETVYSEIEDKTVYIIDVREEYEYNSGHLKNAYNVPLSNINSIDKNWIPLDSKIVVYCHSGNRSKKAADTLIKMGYSNVYDMGGITSWEYEIVSE